MADVDYRRRRFLTVTTSVAVGAGIASVTIPFIQSWKPSARARAAGAPIQVDISKLEPGQMISVKWQGKPVWVLRRTEANIINLIKPEHRYRLRDPDSELNQQPDYAQNGYRSVRPEIFIAIGICTHLGCVPLYQPDGISDTAQSLYYCPCHGSKFDLAGRVFKGVPAPTNLIIPPHQYLSGEIVEIGRDNYMFT